MATFHRVSYVDPETGRRTTHIFDESDYFGAARCARIALIIDNMQDVSLEEFREGCPSCAWDNGEHCRDCRA